VLPVDGSGARARRGRPAGHPGPRDAGGRRARGGPAADHARSLRRLHRARAAVSAVGDLAERFGLSAAAAVHLEALLDGLGEPDAPTTVHARAEAIDVHLADSLVALEVPAVRHAATIADLGAGAGFPGLALAVAMPEARVTLIESAGRKADFIAHLAERAQLSNAHALHVRAEDADGQYDVVTVRAVAGLPVVLEYAAPLLDEGGTAVLWRGRRDP